MPAPRTIPWSAAHGVIASLLGAARPVLIGITGPVGSGKTTLAARLAAAESSAIISTDSYLPDYAAIPELERDLPERADLPLLASHLAALRGGAAADIPVWSFHSHRRDGSRRINPASLIIVEGIHALHGAVAASLDLRIYVDAPREVRWGRWERIELAGERGMGPAKARHHFDTIAEPTFARYAGEYQAAAHVIVLNPDRAAET
jgi:uridine kinase